MSILFCLPFDVCNYICSEYLIKKEWGLLDTAICENKLRPRLLNQLQSKTINIEKASTVNLLKWIQCRGVKLKRLELRKFVLQDEEIMNKFDFNKLEGLIL